MNLGENIYHYRSQKNMSQGDLADALEVSRQSVSKWENNSAVPELDKLMRMAQIFEITIDELVTGEETEQPTPPPPAAPAQPAPAPAAKDASSGRIIAGALLLSCGLLLSLVCLIVLIIKENQYGEDMLAAFILVAFPLIVMGVCCLLIKKHALLICGWVFYIPLWIIGFVLSARAVNATAGGFFLILIIVLGAALSAITLVQLWTKKIQTSMTVRIILTALISLLVLTSVACILPPKDGIIDDFSTLTPVEPD